MVQRVTTNGFAVASLVLSLCWGYGLLSVLAIVFSTIGRKQVAERGQNGGGLATAGLVIGIVGLAFAVILIIGVQPAVAVAARTDPLPPRARRSAAGTPKNKEGSPSWLSAEYRRHHRRHPRCTSRSQ